MSLNHGNTIQLSQNLSESEFGDDFSIIILFVINSTEYKVAVNNRASSSMLVEGRLEILSLKARS